MKTQLEKFILIVFSIGLFSCSQDNNSNTGNNTEAKPNATESIGKGQSGVVDNESQKNIVQVAIGSPDHTTLVTAVQKAELVDVLSNAGPFTVFAPTNDAFNKLPAGTVDNLLKPENKAALQNILQYHVIVGVMKTDNFSDGQVIGEVNGDNVKMTVKDGKVKVNDANIVASIPTSNGIIHVIDAVLLPPSK